jgi:hypothetical protein
LSSPAPVSAGDDQVTDDHKISTSWLNLVEIFFGIITRKAIRRGSFTSVADLMRAIRIFIDAWNEHCQPFLWIKTPEHVAAKARQ